jgi:hypothetical protein
VTENRSNTYCSSSTVFVMRTTPSKIWSPLVHPPVIVVVSPATSMRGQSLAR